MGKKNKGDQGSNNVANVQARKGPDGGIYFSSADSVLDATRKQVKLDHITKPWTREAWERARPWILQQRQKMETGGWSGIDALRTELFVLRKPAPHGSDTEDGFLYVRIPKKFIDFNRSAKSDDDATEAGEGEKKTKRVSKRKENAPSYDLVDPDVWRIRIDGDLETSDVEPNVLLDVPEPFENIFYLIQTLQPGLARIHASRKDVIQQGTRESDTRDDNDGEGGQTIRHRAMVAASESYMRVLPPPFWFRRNETELRKILTDGTFDAALAAAEDKARSGERTIKDVKEKTWEEKVKLDESGNPAGSRKGGRPPRLSAIAAASCLGTPAA